MLPANSDSFTSSFNSIRSLPLLSLLHLLQHLALYRKRDKNGHSGFFLFLRENYSLLLVRVPLAIEEIPHYSCDSQSFHHNWLLNFCKSFFLNRLIWWYDSSFLPCQCELYPLIFNINVSCTLERNYICAWHITHFTYQWILLGKIFSEISVYLLDKRYFPVVFSSLWSLSDFGIRVILAS